MTESSPTPIFYGSAKAEQAKIPKKESKIVTRVKKAVDSWLERIGPKSVENHFVEAHERVLATLNSDQRIEVFTKEADKWRKQGKILGIAATTVDAMLISAGIGLTYLGLRKPSEAAGLAMNTVTRLGYKINNPQLGTLFANKILGFNPLADMQVTLSFNEVKQLTEMYGKKLSLLPSIASAGIIFGSGPGHWLAHLAAGGKEQFGKMKARTNNYVDSGKAAEHAKAVGKTLGDAAKSTAKYVVEHPDEIRKTVETVSRVKRQNAESAQKLAEAKQKAADLALEKEYQDWIAHHPDKAYYEQSGQPYPSKAEYATKKQEEAAKKKANKEVEERGVAKH